MLSFLFCYSRCFPSYVGLAMFCKKTILFVLIRENHKVCQKPYGWVLSSQTQSFRKLCMCASSTPTTRSTNWRCNRWRCVCFRKYSTHSFHTSTFIWIFTVTFFQTKTLSVHHGRPTWLTYRLCFEYRNSYWKVCQSAFSG